MPGKRQKLIVGKNDLLTTHPSLSAELVEVDPRTLTSGSGKKVQWRCKEGHTWEAIVTNRAMKNRGCPYCSRQLPIKGVTDAATTHPNLIHELVHGDLSTLMAGSAVKLTWKCQMGHTWEAILKSRALNGTGCPYCSGKKVNKGINDISSQHSNFASEAFGWDPSEVSIGSNHLLDWKCNYGHIWKATPNSRFGRGRNTPCPKCGGNIVDPGKSDLKTLHPELAEEAYGWDPSQILPGIGKRLNWKCSKGHIWLASPNSRTSKTNKSGCPYCGHQKVLVGENDLATSFPKLAKQADGWDASKVFPKSNRKLQWICDLGHVWKVSPASRIRNDDKDLSGCPVCSNYQLLTGFNDLDTRFPELAAQADGWNPRETLAGSNHKMSWKCANGHVWKASISNRINGTGCPSCAKYGYDPNSDGFLYLFEDSDRGLFQVGITNSPKSRFARHQRHGWRLIQTIGPMDGLLCRNWERSILEYLESKGARMLKNEKMEPFDGYTEAWFKNSFQVSSLSDLMEQVRYYEANSN
jgi:DNA-directed RNA polymerase subunit RPC12/RpoP